jgi:hypothetical protein
MATAHAAIHHHVPIISYKSGDPVVASASVVVLEVDLETVLGGDARRGSATDWLTGWLCVANRACWGRDCAARGYLLVRDRQIVEIDVERLEGVLELVIVDRRAVQRR